jgi:hypothetical protein
MSISGFGTRLVGVVYAEMLVRGNSQERSGLTAVIAWAYGQLFDWYPSICVSKFVSDQDRSQLDGFAISQTRRITKLLEQKREEICSVSEDDWVSNTKFRKVSVERDLENLRVRLLCILKDGLYWLHVKEALQKFQHKYNSCIYLKNFLYLQCNTDIQLCLWHMLESWRKQMKSPFEQSVKVRQRTEEYTLNEYGQLKTRLLDLFRVSNIPLFHQKVNDLRQELSQNRISETVIEYLDNNYFTDDKIVIWVACIFQAEETHVRTANYLERYETYASTCLRNK